VVSIVTVAGCHDLSGIDIAGGFSGGFQCPRLFLIASSKLKKKLIFLHVNYGDKKLLCP